MARHDHTLGTTAVTVEPAEGATDESGTLQLRALILRTEDGSYVSDNFWEVRADGTIAQLGVLTPVTIPGWADVSAEDRPDLAIQTLITGGLLI